MRYLLLLCFPITLLAQSPSYDRNKTFTIPALKEDLQIFRHHLETVHGGLYTYTSKEEMDAYFAELKATLQAPLTELDFYTLISKTSAQIKDAHTGIYASAACLNYVDEQMKLLPLGIRWIDGSLYIRRNFSTKEDLEIGSELLSINGHDAITIFNQLLPMIERDGNNLTSPRRELSGLFMDRYGMVFGEPDTFAVVLKQKDGAIIKYDLASRTWPDQVATWKTRYGFQSNTDKQQLKLAIQGDIATLTVKSWSPGRIKAGKQKFKSFFREAFEQIHAQNVQHLILDMRNNGGGSEVVFMELLGHLLQEPYIVYKELSTRTDQIPDHQYYPNDKVKQLEKFAQKKMIKRGDRFHLKKDASLVPADPLTPHYQGQLYVLINEKSHSATGDLSGLLQAHRLGIFIWNETGGNPYENTAGDAPFLHLPNTGIRVLIPTLKFGINRPDENTGRGVIPDHILIPSIEDIIEGRDVEMQFTLELIKSNR